MFDTHIAAHTRGPAELNRSKPYLGTLVEVSIAADALYTDILAVSQAAFAEIEHIHKLMSFHDDESELSHINNQAYLRPVRVSDHTYRVLEQALELSALSDGLFDVTVGHEMMKAGALPRKFPSSQPGSWEDVELHNNHVRLHRDIKLDLGGIAKGYAVDCAANLLLNSGLAAARYSVNAGGDLWMSHWQGARTMLRHPSPDKAATFYPLAMQQAAVATSNPCHAPGTAQICHTPNRSMVNRCQSVSVFAPKCMLADALTKVAFLEPQHTRILNYFGASAVFFDPHSEPRMIEGPDDFTHI